MTPPPKVFEQIISMTDYEEMFKPSIEKARAEIKGIMSISMIKMTLSENGKDVLIVYKEDSDKKGWLPRPVYPKKTKAWNKFFRNNHTTCVPQIILKHYPVKVIFLFKRSLLNDKIYKSHDLFEYILDAAYS